ncbi:MAG: hypothetical protein RR651_00265 [Lysinibacillus sp.]
MELAREKKELLFRDTSAAGDLAGFEFGRKIGCISNIQKHLKSLQQIGRDNNENI